MDRLKELLTVYLIMQVLCRRNERIHVRKVTYRVTLRTRQHHFMICREFKIIDLTFGFTPLASIELLFWPLF